MAKWVEADVELCGVRFVLTYGRRWNDEWRVTFQRCVPVGNAGHTYQTEDLHTVSADGLLDALDGALAGLSVVSSKVAPAAT